MKNVGKAASKIAIRLANLFVVALYGAFIIPVGVAYLVILIALALIDAIGGTDLCEPFYQWFMKTFNKMLDWDLYDLDWLCINVEEETGIDLF